MGVRALSCAAVLLVGVASVYGYSSGAPNDAGICMSLTPKHPGAPQTSPSPFGLSVSKARVKPGDKVTLTITTTGPKFKGYLVQGRNSNWDENATPVGTFDIDKGSKGLSCSEIVDSSITHNSNDEKSTANVQWKAPEQPGTYVLLTTVVQDGLTYWVRQPSQTITVK